MSKRGRTGMWSRGTPESRFWSKVTRGKDDECWIFGATRQKLGYGIFWLGGKNIPAHRYAWYSKFGAIPEGLFVCHRCDNPPCCNPAHLFLGTHEDNVADRTAKDRNARQRGETNGLAKLDADAVRAIRSARASGQSQKSIAKTVGVDQSNVSLILSGKTWGHVS